MKKMTGMLVVALGLALGLTACGSKSKVDTGKVESSFASAEPATKSTATKAVDAVKAGDYSGALSNLGKLASDAKLTPEQKQAVTDLYEQVKTALSANASKAADDAKKSADDLKKSITH